MKSKAKRENHPIRSLRICFFFYIVYMSAPIVSLAENERDILNKLYNEIITINGSTIRSDSIHTHEQDSLLTEHSLPHSPSDPSSERLHHEIEKIRQP